MPDRRRHRSAAPQDRELFSPTEAPGLRAALTDLAWLRGRGYAEASSLALVGNRFSLRERQREALRRAVASLRECSERRAKELAFLELAGERLGVDGFNLLTTVESALGGGLVLVAQDGCVRDLARLRGTWRRVEETRPALGLIARAVQQAGVAAVTWYLDAPVSNSGRLAHLVREVAPGWEVAVVRDPDAELMASEEVVVTSDRRVLDGCERWTNLGRRVALAVPGAWVLDLESA